MKRRTFPVMFLVALGLLLGSGFHTAAQEGTPVVSGLPVTPDPAECTVEARTIDELLGQAAATPAVGTPVPVDQATPEPFILPGGEPADDATVAGITATMREVMACLNTGNFLTAFEFVTDRAFAEFTAEPMSDEEIEFLREGPPALAPEQYGTLVDVRGATVLPDGRVGATIVTIFRDEVVDDQEQIDYFIFDQVDGRWLIDEIIEDLEAALPVATPVA